MSKQEYVLALRRWQAAYKSAQKATTEDKRIAYNRIASNEANAIFKSLDKLLRKVVQRTCRHHQDLFDDCLGVAQLAILENALPKWDEERAGDMPFPTYALQWITYKVRAYIDKDTPVDIPHDRRREVMVLLAQGKEIPEKLQRYNPQVIYGNSSVKTDESHDDLTLMDLLSSDQSQAAEQLDKETAAVALYEAIAELKNPRDADIARKLIEHHLNRADVARNMGLSRERVSKLFNRIIPELRTALQSKLV